MSFQVGRLGLPFLVQGLGQVDLIWNFGINMKCIPHLLIIHSRNRQLLYTLPQSNSHQLEPENSSSSFHLNPPSQRQTTCQDTKSSMSGHATNAAIAEVQLLWTSVQFAVICGAGIARWRQGRFLLATSKVEGKSD